MTGFNNVWIFRQSTESERYRLPEASQPTGGDAGRSTLTFALSAVADGLGWRRLATFRRVVSGAAINRLVILALPVFAIIVWIMSLERIHLDDMTDIGLISVLPDFYFIAIGSLSLGFALVLRQAKQRNRIFIFYMIPLILMLYGTPALVEGTPRFEATWKHLGVTEYIVLNETASPGFSAYFNWPMFFTISGVFQEVAGLDNLIGTVMWAYLFLNLLFLAPLFMLLRTATTDLRLVWLGIWFFYITNWVGQDYFSPQGFAFFLYLSILAILLRWFRSPIGRPFVTVVNAAASRLQHRLPRLTSLAGGSDEEVVPAAGTRGQRIGAFLTLVGGFGAMVPSHQLTPFAVLFCVGFLVCLGSVSTRGLLAIMAIFVTFWMTFVAVPYFRGHLDDHLESVGTVNQNIEGGVSRRAAKGSDEHRFVVRERVVYSGVVATLAILGGLRRVINRRWDFAMVILVVAPPLLVAIQRYGGEIFLRIFLFSLPALAFFVATLFLPKRTPQVAWRTTLLILITSSLLILGFLTARYGNERADYFSPEEVQAVQYFYDTAEPGSVLLAGSGNLPWKFEGFTEYRYQAISSSTLLDEDLDVVIDRMQSSRQDGRETYLLITRSSKAQRDMFVQPGLLDRYEQLILASDNFESIFVNPDASIYVLKDDA